MIVSELLERGRSVADAMLAKHGSVGAIIFIHVIGESRVVAMPYKDGSAPDDVQRAAITHVMRVLIEEGLFGGAVLMSDAWIAKYTKGQEALVNVMLPSVHPDRQEGIVVCVVAHDGSKHMATWELDRSGDRPKVGKTMDSISGFDSVETWLSDAFKKEAA